MPRLVGGGGTHAGPNHDGRKYKQAEGAGAQYNQCVDGKHQGKQLELDATRIHVHILYQYIWHSHAVHAALAHILWQTQDKRRNQ